MVQLLTGKTIEGTKIFFLFLLKLNLSLIGEIQNRKNFVVAT
jgi:hypothetical protein